MRGPKPQALVLEAEHVEVLRTNVRTGTTEHRVAVRSRVLLLRAGGLCPQQVAERVGCDRTTVWRVERRYRADALGGLRDRPRSGRPPEISPPPAGAGRRLGLPQAG
ncbi:MAG TPA: helix-turn-helix domain-containing protein [Azospirillaceae bacterium]|jgi:hypothetical protein|nr:helix-turn-helix domain-containing protein [Azospirillaceae bacterium]